MKTDLREMERSMAVLKHEVKEVRVQLLFAGCITSQQHACVSKGQEGLVDFPRHGRSSHVCCSAELTKFFEGEKKRTPILKDPIAAVSIFCGRWYCSLWKGPYILRPVSQLSAQCSPLNSSSVGLAEYS